jgi:hypothetical protein
MYVQFTCSQYILSHGDLSEYIVDHVCTILVVFIQHLAFFLVCLTCQLK